MFYSYVKKEKQKNESMKKEREYKSINYKHKTQTVLLTWLRYHTQTPPNRLQIPPWHVSPVYPEKKNTSMEKYSTQRALTHCHTILIHSQPFPSPMNGSVRSCCLLDKTKSRIRRNYSRSRGTGYYRFIVSRGLGTVQ